MPDAAAVAWPIQRAGEALAALARRAGLAAASAEAPASPPAFAAEDPRALVAWADAAAAALGLEAEPVTIAHDDAARFADAGPALARVGTGEGTALLLLLPGGSLARLGGRVRVLGPDLVVRRVGREAVRSLLCRAAEAPLEAAVTDLLDACGVAGERRAAAREAVLAQRLAARPVADGWLLRSRPGGSFVAEARAAGLARPLALVGACLALEHVLWLLAWWIIGRGALAGGLEAPWLALWGLLLATLLPLRLLGSWSQARFSLGAGGLLKRRLLAGALRLAPEEVRREGAGGLLGRVIESDAVESLALAGGFLGIAGVVEVALSAGVLAFGAGGPLHGLLLLAFASGALVLAGALLRRRREWTRHRLALTTDLVECMVGHRTRQAQEPPATRHDAEDLALARHLDLSERMDRATLLVASVAPRAWLLAGFLALLPPLAWGEPSAGGVAIAVGGLLLGHRSLRKLAQGASHLAGAAIAWERVKPLFAAATRVDGEAPPRLAAELALSPSGGSRRSFDTIKAEPVADPSLPVVEARGLVFRHEGRQAAVLDGASLTVRAGERLLLEGVSGSGKSTLAAVLCGLREPSAGLRLHRGLDARTLGARGWRRRVVAAPQFHENHVFAETLAFNLLLGGRWPPSPAQVAEAEAACRALGLGHLLDRMPSGLLQPVGEGGWQLSHGERSRVYVARALLQGAELVVLDESFAALDPESLSDAMACVLERARAVLVIAHP